MDNCLNRRLREWVKLWRWPTKARNRGDYQTRLGEGERGRRMWNLNYLHLSFFVTRYSLHPSYLYAVITSISNALKSDRDTEREQESLETDCLVLLSTESRTDSPDTTKIRFWFASRLDLNFDTYTALLLVNYIRMYRPITVTSEHEAFVALSGLRLLHIPPRNYLNKTQWCLRVESQMEYFKETQPSERISMLQRLRSIQIFPSSPRHSNSYIESEQLSDVISQHSVPTATGVGVTLSNRLRTYTDLALPVEDFDLQNYE